MTATTLLFALIPDALLPLLVLGVGLATLLRLISLRSGLAILAGLLLARLAAPVIESLLATVPLWAAILILLGLAVGAVRVVLELLLGREATGHVIGSLVLAGFRLVSGMVLFPLRRLLRLLTKRRATILLIVIGLSLANQVSGQRAATAASRGLQRGVKRAVTRQIQYILSRDRARDAALRVRMLKVPRTVFRYVPKATARAELRNGLQPGAHTTSRAAAGRPLKPSTAQQRLGLPSRPGARETIRLPSGLLVRLGKVIGGQPGYGELRVDARLPNNAIRRVLPLRQKR